LETCRWTYNQAVAHFRETNVYKASTLRDLYVSRVSSLEREYPLSMGPPPESAHETPSSIRSNTMRKFYANVMIAFSNKANDLISKSHTRLKSKKGNPLTMLSVNARDAQITNAVCEQMQVDKFRSRTLVVETEVEKSTEPTLLTIWTYRRQLDFSSKFQWINPKKRPKRRPSHTQRRLPRLRGSFPPPPRRP
jgi:hypothetical protein